MKSFNASQRVIIIFLTSFIVVCFFLIVRLEIKAANLQSQWDEHKKSLNENMDVINDLKLFARNVKSGGQVKLSNSLIMRGGGGNNHLILDPSGSISFENLTNGSKYFGYDSKEKLTYMYGIGKGKKVKIKGETLLMESADGDHSILISDKIVAIDCGGLNGPRLGFWISIDEQKVWMYTDKSEIRLDKDIINVEAEGDINITSKNGNVNIKGKKVKVNE